MYSAACDAAESAGIPLDSITKIGAAVPSPVDPETEECLFAANLGWKNVPFRDLLQNRFGIAPVIGNDGNLGLLAEHVCGAAKGFRTAVGYFIGTGLGGGILINGTVHHGMMGLAGELGHCIIHAGGRRCSCGKRGCVEAYCSKTAFVKALKKEVFRRGNTTLLPDDKFNEDSKNIKSKYLARAYKSGDPVVKKVIDKGLQMLGTAAAGICAAVAPECIILGGGFTESMGDDVLPPFKASFESHLFGISPALISIRRSALGDDAVAVGAAILAENKYRPD
jgi:glucokinase